MKEEKLDNSMAEEVEVAEERELENAESAEALEIEIAKGEEKDDEVQQEAETEASQKATKEPDKKRKLILVGVAIVAVAVVAFSISQISKKPEKSPEINNNNNNNTIDYPPCCNTDDTKSVTVGKYIIEMRGSDAYLLDAKTREILQKFEAVQEARLYYDTIFDEKLWEDVPSRYYGVILRQNNTEAFFNLSLDKMTIPFGEYNELDDQLIRYTSSWRDDDPTNYPVEYIVARINKENGYDLAVVSIVTGKQIMPAREYSDIQDVNKHVFLVSKENGEDYIYGLVSKTSGKEIVALNYDDIQCGFYACAVYSNDWQDIQIYDTAKNAYLDFDGSYLQSSEAKQMFRIIKSLGHLDFGKQKITDMNNLNNDVKKEIAIWNSPLRNGDDDVYVKASVVTKALQKFFGPSVTFTHGGIKCDRGDVLISYDKKKDSYYWDPNHDGHGGGGVHNILSYIVDYQAIEGFYEISVKMLYAYQDDDEYTGPDFYGDVQNKVKLFSGSTVSTKEDLVLADALYFYYQKLSTYRDKSPTYKYVFEKVGEDYFIVGYDYIPGK